MTDLLQVLDILKFFEAIERGFSGKTCLWQSGHFDRFFNETNLDHPSCLWGQVWGHSYLDFEQPPILGVHT